MISDKEADAFVVESVVEEGTVKSRSWLPYEKWRLGEGSEGSVASWRSAFMHVTILKCRGKFGGTRESKPLYSFVSRRRIKVQLRNLSSAACLTSLSTKRDFCIEVTACFHVLKHIPALLLTYFRLVCTSLWCFWLYLRSLWLLGKVLLW